MSKYIDVEKAIEVCDWYEHEYSECEEYIRTIAEDIRHLPAADVAEVRHGRWEDEVYTAGALKMYGHKCSACGAITPVSVAKYRYCPNCGAKMDEVTDD